MNTTKLNKTNINGIDVNKIESFLGHEIDSVNNYINGYIRSSVEILPVSVIYQNNYPCSNLRPFTKINKNYSFNRENGELVVTGRDKWKRSLTTTLYQFKKIGYKLPTTSIIEGYIWGAAVRVF